MRRSNLITISVSLTLMLLLVVSCKSNGTPEPTHATTTGVAESLEESTEVSEDRVAAPAPVEPDTSLYGHLSALDPSDQIVIYWHHHTGSYEQLLLSMIDEFNRTNEWGISVFGESQGSFDDLHGRIIDGIQNSRLPNIATAPQHRAANYAAQGVLIPFAPYVESEEWGYTREELDDFFPAVLTAGVLPQSGVRYGYFLYRAMEVMVYNEDWLTELGYAEPPTTWDEFAEIACVASEQPFSRAAGESSAHGYVYNPSPAFLATLLFSRGGDIINESGTRYIFNRPEGLEALAFVKNLADQGCATGQTGGHDDQSFGLGQILFTIDSTSRLPYYRKTVDEGAGFNWSVSPPPHTLAAPRMNAYGTSQLVFVSNPEGQLAAWLFIKWMSEPEQQARWAKGTGYFPIRASTANLMADYFAEHPAYERAFAYMALDHGTEPSVTGYDECREVIFGMLADVLDGRDVQSQLDSAVGRCNAYLKDAPP
jgi:ABC-type glycerol-3-phosphate transport system substrate-binding protein